MQKITTPTFVPFTPYRFKQIRAQEGINGDDKMLLDLIVHSDRKNGGKGADLTLLQYAEALCCTYNQVRKRMERLRGKGLVVNVGKKYRGDALRRVRLTTVLKPGVRGATIPFEINGIPGYRKRRTGEKNPAIETIDLGQTPTPLEVQHRKVFGSPQSPMVPCKQGTEGSFFTGKESVVTPLQTTEQPKLPVLTHVVDVPAEEQPLGKATPIIPAARGRREIDWVAQFHAIPVAATLCKRFNQPNVTPALARKLIKRFRNGTCNDASVRFVLRNLDALPGDETDGARRPQTLEDFLRRFELMVKHLLSNEATIQRASLQADIELLEQQKPRPALEFGRFTRALQRERYTSFDDFLVRGDVTLAWAAAFYFRLRGEEVACHAELSQITVSLVKNRMRPAECLPACH